MIKTFVGGELRENCYIVSDDNTKEALVIDPGYKEEGIYKFILENNLKVKYIYLTHCHFDHIYGASWLREKINAPILCLDKELENVQNEDVTMGKFVILESVTVNPDKVLSENDKIALGNLEFKVIHTPGHTSGSSCLYGNSMLFSGDTLFKNTHGRCDLPTGSLTSIINSIKQKLFNLPDDVVVYPGHGVPTTILEEKQNQDFEY